MRGYHGLWGSELCPHQGLGKVQERFRPLEWYGILGRFPQGGGVAFACLLRTISALRRLRVSGLGLGLRRLTGNS